VRDYKVSGSEQRYIRDQRVPADMIEMKVRVDASSVPASGAPERDNKWPDGTRVMVRNKPKSWSEAG
jgi:hypothetical protein